MILKKLYFFCQRQIALSENVFIYVVILKNAFQPALIDIIETGQLYCEGNPSFQGAILHYGLPVQHFLEKPFPDRRINRKDAIEIENYSTQPED